MILEKVNFRCHSSSNVLIKYNWFSIIWKFKKYLSYFELKKNIYWYFKLMKVRCISSKSHKRSIKLTLSINCMKKISITFHRYHMIFNMNWLSNLIFDIGKKKLKGKFISFSNFLIFLPKSFFHKFFSGIFFSFHYSYSILIWFFLSLRKHIPQQFWKIKE